MLKSNSRYEILTPSGFKPFSGVQKTRKLQHMKITHDKGRELHCTIDHKINTVNGFVQAKYLKTNDILLTKFGPAKIQNIEHFNNVDFFYDAIDVGEDHQYYTNDVISHNCAFLGSSNTLISGKKLSTMTFISPIEFSDQVYIFENPKPNGNYVIVADVARGVGNDYSAFVIFDITSYPYRVVGKFKDNNVSHLIFPQYIYQFATAYNNAFVLVEINDIGQIVSDILFNDFEYENMLLIQAKGAKGQQVGGGWGGTQPVFGVRTTMPVKRIGCANLKSMVEQDKLIIQDEHILYELSRFVQTKNSYAAEEGSHDDLVMCCVLFAWLVHQDYFKEISDNDIRATLSKDNERLINDSMLPFGFISDGVAEYEETISSTPDSYSISAFGEW